VVEIEFADLRGTFFGSMTMTNKKDFGQIMVEEGLA
jgi:endonuclease YncB( thermonuclease family)